MKEQNMSENENAESTGAVVAKVVGTVLIVAVIVCGMVAYFRTSEESWRLRYCIEQTGQPCETPTTTTIR